MKARRRFLYLCTCGWRRHRSGRGQERPMRRLIMLSAANISAPPGSSSSFSLLIAVSTVTTSSCLVREKKPQECTCTCTVGVTGGGPAAGGPSWHPFKIKASVPWGAEVRPPARHHTSDIPSPPSLTWTGLIRRRSQCCQCCFLPIPGTANAGSCQSVAACRPLIGGSGPSSSVTKGSDSR